MLTIYGRQLLAEFYAWLRNYKADNHVVRELVKEFEAAREPQPWKDHP